MSKWGSLGHFLIAVGKFAPLILAATPLAPIAGPVAAAIQEAEAIQGASGPEKLAHVVQVAQESARVAKAAGAPVDPQAVQAAAIAAINAVVAVVNATKPVAA